MQNKKAIRKATIEINRSMVLRDPIGVRQPMVALVRPEIPGAQRVADAVEESAASVRSYRVVDGRGPCYEFQGVATCRGDLVEISPVGSPNKLR